MHLEYIDIVLISFNSLVDTGRIYNTASADVGGHDNF